MIEKGIATELKRVQNCIDNLDANLMDIGIALEKADHVVDAIECKYGLCGKGKEDYTPIRQQELLVDIRIVQDYIRQAHELSQNISRVMFAVES